MSTLYEHKELETLETPLLLFELQTKSGGVERWSTHDVNIAGTVYAGRITQHDGFELRSMAEGFHDAGKIGLVIANPDGLYNPLSVRTSWKGASLSVRFVFVNLATGDVVGDSIAVFRGTCGGIDEATEKTLRLSFHHRIHVRRTALPTVGIQERCPWTFPADAIQRSSGVDGGAEGLYSAFFRCGYSPDIPGGCGNSGTSGPYTSCGYTRQSCQERGMYSVDENSRPTARFGGFPFVSHHNSNDNRNGMLAPLVYGTAWINPPVLLARAESRMTHFHVVLASDSIEGLVKVVANQYEIPEFQESLAMESTGWFRLVNNGNRIGQADPDIPNSPATGDPSPCGSFAYLHLALPNSILRAGSSPQVKCLVNGSRLSRFDELGAPIAPSFSGNPAWILLDLLRRSGWKIDELDVVSFAKAATSCDELVEYPAEGGTTVILPRLRCNIALQTSMSLADLVRGLYYSTGLFLRFNIQGELSVALESTLGEQAPERPSGSNALGPLQGGWPAYEFGDGTDGLSGIARRANGDPAIRFYSRAMSDTPNFVTATFCDELDGYQSDSYTLVDLADLEVTAQRVALSARAIGLPHIHQASRTAKLLLMKSVHGNFYVDFETSVRAMGVAPGDIVTITYASQGLYRVPFRVLRISPTSNYSLVRIVGQLHADEWYSAPTQPTSRERRFIDPSAFPRPICGIHLLDSGRTTLDLEESPLTASDGSGSVSLTAHFLPPEAPSLPPSSTPAIAQQATANPTGGSLAGSRTLYYAVTALDNDGRESSPSPLAVARLNNGNTYAVTLRGLTFGPSTVAFNVYRGNTPQSLLRIASSAPLGNTFVDDGLSCTLAIPPDRAFDKASFYWRTELSPPVAATISSAISLGNTACGFTPEEFRGSVVRVHSGKGEGQERVVASNTNNAITVISPFSVVPDSTSTFLIAENGWHHAVTSTTSPAAFEIPNRQGMMVHVVANAVAAGGMETDTGLGPFTRWLIGGGTGLASDSNVPAIPNFGIMVAGQGNVEVMGFSFPTLLNTRTIRSGTLALHYWDELAERTMLQTVGYIDATTEYLDVSPAVSTVVGDLLQLGNELLRVREILNGGTRLRVIRQSHGTTGSQHSTGSSVYPLMRRLHVIPFQSELFGSTASGSLRYSWLMPHVRVVASDLYVTNSFGNSPVREVSFLNTSDSGLRTLAGGQYSIQVHGFLSLEEAATPACIVDRDCSIRDIRAFVRQAPTGGDIQLALWQNDTLVTTLSISDGSTSSQVVLGKELPALRSQSRLTLDITGVPANSVDSPGRDLTVVVRL